MNMAPPRQLAPVLFPRPVTAAVYRSNQQSESSAEDLRCKCNKSEDDDEDEDIFETWKMQLRQRPESTG